MFNERISTEEQLRAVIGHQSHRVLAKHARALDAHSRAFIAASPYVVIGSADRRGAIDVSPKGDPPGFVKVLNQLTLAIPDRLGNHRGDTLLNVLVNPNVGIVFIVHKRREVVRVSGTAQVARDPDLLETMAVGGKVPDLALVVHVREAFFHCGKSMIRSGMWNTRTMGVH